MPRRSDYCGHARQAHGLRRLPVSRHLPAVWHVRRDAPPFPGKRASTWLAPLGVAVFVAGMLQFRLPVVIWKEASHVRCQ
jgi:hypothetical protein